MSQHLFAARLNQNDPTRKDVITISADEAANLSGYDNLAIMSIDGLLRPVSKTGDGGLPKFMTPSLEFSGSGQSYQSFAPMTPFYTGNTFLPEDLVFPGHININYLDPFSDPISNPTFFNDLKVSGTGTTVHSGFDIEAVARATTGDIDSTSGVFTIRDTLDTGVDASGYKSNNSGIGYTGSYRFTAVKGPVVIHGWGYDTMGLPVPNAIGDVSGEIDNFYTGKANRFQEHFLADATKWPVAPIDLRLDRKRGVWVSPPSFKVVSIEASGGPIHTGSIGTGVIIGSSGLYNASGEAVETGFIKYYNNSANHTVVSGEQILLHYDVNDGRYIPYNLPSRSNGIIRCIIDDAFTSSDPDFNATVARGNIGGYQENDPIVVTNDISKNGLANDVCLVYVDSVADIAELVNLEC